MLIQLLLTAPTPGSAEALLPGWTGVFVQLGSFGVVCFVVYWHHVHEGPRRERAHADEVTRIETARDSERAGHKAELEALRKTFADATAVAAKAFDDEQQRLRHDHRNREQDLMSSRAALQQQLLNLAAKGRLDPSA